MVERISLQKPRRKKGKWWIPAEPPHFDVEVGPYKYFEEAIEEKEGMERTINSPTWRMMILEHKEKEERAAEKLERQWQKRIEDIKEFEREWEAAKRFKNL